MILVDTCIWSEALRKRFSDRIEVIEKLKIIITQNQVAIIGAIRQEILFGLKTSGTFKKF